MSPLARLVLRKWHEEGLNPNAMSRRVVAHGFTDFVSAESFRDLAKDAFKGPLKGRSVEAVACALGESVERIRALDNMRWAGGEPAGVPTAGVVEAIEADPELLDDHKQALIVHYRVLAKSAREIRAGRRRTRRSLAEATEAALLEERDVARAERSQGAKRGSSGRRRKSS